MGVRLNVDLAAQIGRDNDLGRPAFEGAYQAVLDTLDHVTSSTVVLDAGESNYAVPFGDVAQARFVWIEADGPIRVTPGGGLATSAQLDGAAGAYPTGFAGGEGLAVEIDGAPVTVVFEAGDQSLAQVIGRVNAAAALAGVSGPGGVPVTIARDTGGGQLRLVSPKTGTTSTVAVTAIDPAVATALGLAVTSVAGVNASPGQTPVTLMLPQSSGAAAQPGSARSYLVATLVTTGLTVDNLDPDNPTTVALAVAGDLVTAPVC